MRTRSVGFRVLLRVPWLLSSVLLASCSAEPPRTGCPADDGPVRLPAVAGGFYPASPAELAAEIDRMLAEANPPPVEGRVRALIVPHAGYVYSGPVAAHAFKAIAGKPYKTVVLIGNSHKEGYDGASVYPKGKFKTPLGDVEIDSELARKLMDYNPRRIFYRESAHLPEHSLEVEIPFLQKTLGDFRLVPILLGTESMDVARVLGEALAKSAGENTLVVTSSDMSHYPAYDDARFADHKTIESILTGDADNYERTLRQLERMGIPNAATFMCGEGATKALMAYAAKIGADKIQLLKYANSGDSPAGSKSGGVVGYCAVSFSDGGSFDMKKEEKKPAAGDEVLNADERKAALELAKQTVEGCVRSRAKPEWKNNGTALDQPLGAFVTLRRKSRNNELRGCIGRFQPDIPLGQVIIEMAVAAATQDMRFPPVSPAELDDLSYEISVLSPLRRIQDGHEIELGRHGVEVVRGFRHGVFLPQVATETGWDLDTFMGQLCSQKAGLKWDAWKDPETELYVFTAQVFSDEL